MSELRSCKLADVVSFGNGKARPFTEGDIPIYGGNGILGYCADNNYKGETIVIGRVGAYCGATYYENQPIWISDNALSAKPKGQNNTKFFYYFLKDMDLNQHAGGSSHPLVTQTLLNSLDVEIVDSPKEQKAIASVLSSLDDKIDLLHRQNTTLECMAETLFRQWFLEEAQNDWEKIGFGKFITPKKGKNITKADAVDGIYPVIAGGLTPSCFHNEANTNSPVITISASGANAGFVCLHHSQVWSSDSSYIDNTVTKYVYFCYVFLKYNQSVLTDKQEGSAQPHIYPSHIMALGTLNYPLDLIENFENKIKDTFEKVKLNQKQIQTLEKLRDNLLPKLMSGEVRVA